MPRLPHQRPNEGPPEPSELAELLVPLAAELVGTVRDYGLADVAKVLARVPGRPAEFGALDALAVVLAAMVDPDRKPSELLAWSLGGPVPSTDRTPLHLLVKNAPPESLGRRAERRTEVARLTGLQLSSREIAERLGISKRSVDRHRAALRDAALAAQAEAS